MYKKTVEFFKSKSHNISISRLDNETSSSLESYFKEVKIPFQYISPNNKRANKAERAIRSFKNHFIAGLSTVDPDFPMALWDDLLPQSELTLNLLRPSASNTNISAYEGVYGCKYDFLAHPIAPLGTKVLVFDPPDMRASWSAHGVLGYYLGPALDHYRNVKVFIPSTNGYRITDQCDYFPSKFKFPGSTKEEIMLDAITHLDHSIANSKPLDIVTEAANKLKAILDNALPSGPTSDIGTGTNQRVDSNQKSSVPTSPINQRVETKQHVLSAKRKISKQKLSNYRELLPEEKRYSKIRTLVSRIGQHFVDKETNEELIIDSVVMPKKAKGKGSNTPHYKMFLTSQYKLPTTNREFEYTRCSEIENAKYVSWIKRGTSATAAAILSSEPRDKSRALNQTIDGKPLNYKKAVNSIDHDLWVKCDEEEWCRLLDKDTIQPCHPWEIPIEQRGNVAYYNRQIKEKLKVINGEEFIESRVRGTFGGNVIKYDGPVSSNTAEYPVVKLLFNSVLSDAKNKNKDTRFASADLVDHYLATPMEEPGYMCVPIEQIPTSIINKYELAKFVYHDRIRFKVLKCMYGHPVSGRLSNILLTKTLKNAGYYEDELTPCLFHHPTRNIKFVLIVDDLGIKYSKLEDLDHLCEAIGKVWKVKVDKTGSKFLGMMLKWEYDLPIPRLTLDSPTVVPDALKRFCPNRVLKGKDTPSIYKPPSYGKSSNSQAAPIDKPECKKFVQQVTGTFSHYSRTIDYTMLEAVNTISQKQANPTSETMEQVERLLNYAARYPNNKLVMEASDMILRSQYDASFQCLPDGRSKVGYIHYLANKNDPPEKVRNIFDATSKVLHANAASVVEAEYGAAFLSGQDAYAYANTLNSLGHKQPPIVFYGDNQIAVGISNDTVKVKRAKAIEKSYHWFRSKCRQGEFVSRSIPGELNTSDFFTKALPNDRNAKLSRNIVFIPKQNHNNLSRKRKNKP